MGKSIYLLLLRNLVLGLSKDAIKISVLPDADDGI